MSISVSTADVGTTVSTAEIEDNAIEPIKATSALAQFNLKKYGAVGDGSTDDYDAFQAAITAAEAAGGGVVLGVSGATYYLNKSGSTGLKLARNNAGTRGPVVVDLNGATVKLSSNTPRFLDFNRVADYDTFQKIEVRNGTVDCNSIGGTHHVILGNWPAGAAAARLNFDDIRVHDIRVLNVPTDPALVTSRRHGIHIRLSTTGSDEATQITATNILVERVRIAGGAAGVYIGSRTTDLTLTPNAWLDNIVVRDLTHDTGAVQTTNFASAAVQIGEWALCGKVRIEGVLSDNSGDVAVEVDNAADAEIRGCRSTDSNGYSFLTTNFRVTANTNGLGSDWSVYAQSNRWVDCYGKRKALVNTTDSAAIGRTFVTTDNSVAIGSVSYTRCALHRTAADTDSTTLGEAFYFAGAVHRITVRNCEAAIENIANASGTHTYSPFYVNTSNGTISTLLTVRGFKVRASGAIAGGTWSFYGLSVNQTTATQDLLFDIDQPDYDVAITTSGGTIGNLIGIDLGRTLLHAGGILSGIRASAFGTYSGRIGINVSSTSTFTCRGIMVRSPDFSGWSSSEVNFGGSNTTSNASKVIVRDPVRWTNNNANRSPAGRVPVAASASMGPFDEVVAVTSTAAARTITLPFAAAVPPGKAYVVKDESNAAGTNNISVTCQTGDFWEDGSTTTKTISANAGRLAFFSNGTRWQEVT